MHVTDSGTGVANVALSLQNPLGSNFYCAGGTLVGGTIYDGDWTCSLAIPAGAAAGTWSIFYVEAHDGAGNSKLLSGAQAAALSGGITVVNAQSDLQAPQIASVSFSPSTVTLNGSPGTTTATMHVTDSGTGVANVALSLQNPLGSNFYCAGGTLVGGTIYDGDWTCSLAIPAGAAAGTWSIFYVEAHDGAGTPSS